MEAVITRARAGVSAVAAVRASNTLKEIGEGTHRSTPRITRTADRERIWRAQTPQGFPRQMLHDAYARLGAAGNGGARGEDGQGAGGAGDPPAGRPRPPGHPRTSAPPRLP